MKQHRLSLVASLEALIIIVLIAILVEPYLITRANTSTGETTDPTMMQKEFLLPAGDPVPTISFTLAKDAIGGYDLHLDTTNFTFTPQNINQVAVADQGHVHLYIDGRLSLLFGDWYHIDSLAPGNHTITASLNANDHSVFAEEGKAIESTQTITVPPIQ